MKAITLQKPVRMFLALVLISLTSLGPWSISPVKGLSAYVVDDGLIAFIRNDSLWVINPDDGGQKQLAEFNSLWDGVIWSPTGAKLLAQPPGRNRDFPVSNELWIVDPDGQNLLQIADALSNYAAAWSPNGEKVAYIKLTGGYEFTSEVYVFDIPSGKRTPITSNSTLKKSLAWSPDGTEIAYTMYNLQQPEINNLVIINLQTLQETYLTEVPDSTVIYYIGKSLDLFLQSGNGSEIFNRASNSKTALANNIAGIASWSWSPDGNKLAFAFRDGDEVYVGDSENWDWGKLENLQKIADGPKYLTSFAWSPDGSKVTFSDPPFLEKGVIYVVNADGSDLKALTEGHSPQWQPLPAPLGPSLEELIARKEAVMPGLKEVSYDTGCGYSDKLPAYNEDAATELIGKLKTLQQSNPAAIPPEQSEAFSRLVLQEETLKTTLMDYSLVNNDQTDAVTDTIMMVIGTQLLLLDPSSIISKTFADFVKLWLGGIEDSNIRDFTEHGLDIGFEYAFEHAVSFESFLQLATDCSLRKIVSQVFVGGLIDRIQPTLDQGVRSVSGDSEEKWAVAGNDELAELQLDHIEFVSKTTSETAHSQYEQLAHARAINEFLKDFTDIASLGGKVSHARIFSLWTRLQQVLINRWAYKISRCIINIQDRTSPIFLITPGRLRFTASAITGQTIWLS